LKKIVSYQFAVLSIVLLLFIGMFGNAILSSTNMLLDFIPEPIEISDFFDSNETEDDQVEENAEHKISIPTNLLKFGQSSKHVKTDFRYLLSLLHHKETPTPPPDFFLVK